MYMTMLQWYSEHFHINPLWCREGTGMYSPGRDVCKFHHSGKDSAHIHSELHEW